MHKKSKGNALEESHKRAIYGLESELYTDIWKKWVTDIVFRVRLMCALRVHIKLSIFENIFSRIEKAVNTFSIPEKFFSKNG